MVISDQFNIYPEFTYFRCKVNILSNQRTAFCDSRQKQISTNWRNALFLKQFLSKDACNQMYQKKIHALFTYAVQAFFISCYNINSEKSCEKFLKMTLLFYAVRQVGF